MSDKTCKDCVSFGYVNDEEDTVCLAGAGLVCENTQACIYFENKNKIVGHETLVK